MRIEAKLIWTTYVLGLVSLLGGLSIFLTWWVGKSWLMVTLHRLEIYGMYWILISIPIGLIGLLTGGAYLIRASKTNLVKGTLGVLCILINIPVLLWVLKKQLDIEKRAYVKIYNQTEVEIKVLTLENSDFKREFKTLENEDSKTRYFYPKYLNGEFDSAPRVDDVTLTIQTEGDEKVLNVPTIYKGECVRIYLSKEFNVKIKRQYE